MSDTEEVVIPRSKPVAKPKDTKPEIAREKLKEKRERLKKEKEDKIIEEAKKRLALEFEKKQQEEVLLKQQEEEKKKSDPMYAMMMKMEQMMSMFNSKPVKKVQIEEPEEEPVEEIKPKRKPRVVKPKETKPKEPKVKEPKPIENVPKRKKKVVYLQKDPIMETSTQFVGYDIAPPAEPIQYQPSSGLLNAMMSRRNMNSYY